MKELEKTKRISIATTLFILVVLIGVLSFKRPKNLYSFNTVETLEKIGAENLFVTLEDINNPDFVLVDVRKNYNFDRGHLENAININSAAILDDENIDIFKELQNTNKTVVLYGKDPEQAIAPYMILYQLGYTNLKVLPVENSYNQNKLITKTVEVEKYANDINGFIAESIKKSAVVKKPKVEVKPQPKKVITIEKKKAAPTEGGC
ncbi:rhodanese-like domain-containing protein [Lutibacter sp.]|uniref:rhodanese-like domain-containing protein n=1 Tax=Lutibacter sp. TaxID=1925666 RepID=UPI002732FC80|nr:rhodanese-like domain-containing protein [Lutibacter sp.]MDP3312007.1 rhodanese-like domain-containing protein [Lutibacter sp.]